MDAPTYPAAEAYAPPAPTPYVLTVDSASIADLLSSPTIRAMVLREMPALEPRLQAPQLQPHLSNFTLRTLVAFGGIPPDALDRVDAQLRALPASEHPRP